MLGSSQQALSWSERLLAPYRRITSSGMFIPEIDGLRFLAIFSVFIYHLAGNVLRHSPAGYTAELQSDRLFFLTQQLSVGVPMFFVISGFILGLPFAKAHRGLARPVSLKSYLWRRVTRLEPPYVVSMLLFFCLKIIGSRGAPSDLAPNLGASLLYIHNIIYLEPSIISVVAWSLEVEVQFYLLAPVLSLVFTVSNTAVRRFLITAAIIAASAAAWRFAHVPIVHLSLLGNAQYFLGGFLLSDLYLSKQAAGNRSAATWNVLAALGWGAVALGLLAAPSLVQLTGGLAFPLVYFASMHAPAARAILRNVWLTTIGGMCYSIYLLHNYAIALVGFAVAGIGAHLPFAARLLVQFLLITPVVLLASAIYFRLLEKPCMRPDWPARFRAALTDWNGSRRILRALRGGAV